MRKSLTLNFVAPVLLLLTFTSPAAYAQSDRDPESPWSYADEDGRWFLELGLEVEREPDYPGSDDAEVEPMPLFQWTFRGERGNQYYLGLGEIGTKITLGNDWALVASAGIEDGREAEDNEALRGLDPIDEGVDVAVGLWKRVGPWLFAVQGQYDLGNDKGFVGFLGAGYERELREVWRLRLGIDFSWANAEHLQTELGITATESARTGYQVFKPGGGPKTLTAGIAIERMIGTRIFLLGEIEVERYLDEAAESPLIREVGSDTGFEAGLSLRWRF